MLAVLPVLLPAHVAPAAAALPQPRRPPPPPVVLAGVTLLHLLPARGRGPPLKAGENATYTDGHAVCLGEAASARACEQRTVAAPDGRFSSFTYFARSPASAAGEAWAGLCYGRTDEAFTPFPQAGTVSGRRVRACSWVAGGGV